MSLRTTPADDLAPVHDEDEDQDDNVATPDVGKTIMRAWLDQHQPAPVPGTQRDSPANSPGARAASQLASGHPVSPGTYGTRYDAATVTPRALAGLCTVSGSGPLASSIQAHQGRASVQVMDQSAVSNASLGPQLGPREPSGNPHLSASIGERTAPSGHGQSGATPQRPAGPAAYHVTGEVYSQRSAPVVIPGRSGE